MKKRMWLVEKRFQKTKNGLTQQDVADKIGIPRGTYASIECGHRNPRIPTAKKIAAYLGFTWKKFYD